MDQRGVEFSRSLKASALRETTMLRTFCLLFAMNALPGSPAEPASDTRNQPAPAPAAKKPRARDLGIPFEGMPGPHNAITDVRGVEVGHTTLIAGEGKLDVRVEWRLAHRDALSPPRVEQLGHHPADRENGAGWLHGPVPHGGKLADFGAYPHGSSH